MHASIFIALGIAEILFGENPLDVIALCDDDDIVLHHLFIHSIHINSTRRGPGRALTACREMDVDNGLPTLVGRAGVNIVGTCCHKEQCQQGDDGGIYLHTEVT